MTRAKQILEVLELFESLKWIESEASYGKHLTASTPIGKVVLSVDSGQVYSIELDSTNLFSAQMPEEALSINDAKGRIEELVKIHKSNSMKILKNPDYMKGFLKNLKVPKWMEGQESASDVLFQLTDFFDYYLESKVFDLDSMLQRAKYYKAKDALYSKEGQKYLYSSLSRSPEFKDLFFRFKNNDKGISFSDIKNKAIGKLAIKKGKDPIAMLFGF
jgi:hypothetical protein